MALIHWWRLEETSGTVYNSAKSGADGTISGATSVPGMFGNCLRFTGTNYVQVATQSDLAFVDKPFTISAWVLRETEHTTGYPTVVGQLNASGYGWVLFLHQSYLGRVSFSQSSGTWSSISRIDDGKWHHVVVTRNGSSLAFYIDGTPDGGTGSYSNQTTNTSICRIGNDTNSTGRPFGGSIDEVMIWNEALSTEQVKQLYYNTLPSVTSRRRLEPDENTVGLYRLDHVTGNTTKNLASSNAGDGSDSGYTTALSYANADEVPFCPVHNWTASSAQRFIIPRATDLEPAAELTMECWFKPTGFRSGSNTLIHKHDGLSTNLGYQLWISYTAGGDCHLASFFCITASTNYCITRYRFNPTEILGKWNHAVGTYHGPTKTAKLYLNGNLVQTLTHAFGTSNIVHATSTPLVIGNGQVGTTTAMSGDIAEVRISKVARSAAEIFNTYRALTDPMRPFEVEAGKTLFCANFDNDPGAGVAGTTVVDASSYANHGVIGSVNIPVASSPVGLPAVAKCYDFGGTANRKIAFPNASHLHLNADKTFELWVMVTNYADASYAFMKRPASGGPWWGILASGNGNWYGTFNDNAGHTVGPSFGAIVLNRLEYLALTVDTATATWKCYRNGSLVSTIAEPSFVFSNTNSDAMTIGSGVAAEYPTRGKIHAAHITNYVKTPEQIYEYYRGADIVEDN